MANGVKIKTKEDIVLLRESGKRLATVLEAVAKEVRPGITTRELNDFVYKMIIDMGDVPAFLHYKPFGAAYPYPGSICLSVNDEAVHGIGGDRVLKEGDIIKLDGGLKHKGLITDSAVTVAVGEISEADRKLLEVTKQALFSGIKAAKAGNYVSDISKAIEKSVPSKYKIIKILAGHGVGYKVHEEPTVPNFDDGIKGPKLVPGMVLALEPIISMGTEDVYLADDGYTFITDDHSNVAQFEHSILITEGEAEILTKK
jgi:methionyl aminopeptidase